MRALRIAALALAGLAALPAAAETTVSLDVLHRVIKADPSGNRVMSYEPVDTAVPGEGLVYRMTLVNADAVAARSVGMTLPIDPNMLIDPSSISSPEGAVDAVFSVDGGQTFAAMAELSVPTEDGMRPAEAGDLTHVRIGVDEVPANSTSTVQFDAMIR